MLKTIFVCLTEKNYARFCNESERLLCPSLLSEGIHTIYLNTEALLTLQTDTLHNSLILSDSPAILSFSIKERIPFAAYINPSDEAELFDRADFILYGVSEIDALYLQRIYQHSLKLPAIICHTHRLTLRELSSEDVTELYRIYSTPCVTDYIPKLSDSIDTEKQKLNSYLYEACQFYGFGLWGILRKEDQKLIGRCGLEVVQPDDFDSENDIALGYVLDSGEWGQGYAFEAADAVLSIAFNEYELPHVIAIIEKENFRSIRLAKKLGMEYLKDTTYQGRICSIYCIHNPQL